MKTMKKILTTLFVALIPFIATAQSPNDNTLKFLGIPVDGNKMEMIQQLQKKGFIYDKTNEMLTGRFNGKESHIRISENYGKVDRVFVTDADTFSEAQIIINFNNLLHQFKQNEKYVELIENQPIPANEDVSYEMSIHNKTYDAQFYLRPQFTEEETEELAIKSQEIENEGERESFLIKAVMNKLTGMVWFRIADYYGKYYICIYYDNLKNRPNGEDL